MEKLLLQNLFKRVKSGTYKVTYWDGTTEQYGESDPFFKLIFHEKIPYKRIVNDPALTFGEAYMDGTIEFTGELDEIIKVVNLENDLLGQNRVGRI